MEDGEAKGRRKFSSRGKTGATGTVPTRYREEERKKQKVSLTERVYGSAEMSEDQENFIFARQQARRRQRDFRKIQHPREQTSNSKTTINGRSLCKDKMTREKVDIFYKTKGESSNVWKILRVSY